MKKYNYIVSVVMLAAGGLHLLRDRAPMTIGIVRPEKPRRLALQFLAGGSGGAVRRPDHPDDVSAANPEMEKEDHRLEGSRHEKGLHHAGTCWSSSLFS